MPKIVSSITETLHFPSGLSIGRIMFEKLQEHSSDIVGMVDAVSKVRITYAEILEDTIKVALRLRKLGIQKEDRVFLVSENSIYFYTYVIACWYIGATVCPMSSTYTTYELDSAIKLLSPKMYICSKNTVKVLQETRKDLKAERILIVGEIPDEDKVNLFTPEDCDPTTTNAMILMSSGTTGLPKGVVWTHDNVMGNIAIFGCNPLIATTPGDAYIGILPFYHTFGIIVSLGFIYSKLKIVVMDKFVPDVFLNSIQEFKVTKLFVVPPIAIFLAKSLMVDDYDVSSLKDIVCAASSLGKDVQSMIRQRLHTVVRQAYGLTECGLVTMDPFETSTSMGKFGASGVLIPDTIAKVVNIETNVEVGPNEMGELCFKSKSVMRYYLNNEEATREAIDEEQFLHTGDLGFYDEDGYFFVVDRLKELIKYKGFQVAPAELENILLTHDAVKDAAIIGVPDERAGELSCALVVLQPGKTATEDEIKDFVSGMVSYYKRLSGGVKFVDEIPKNPSGKIMRKFLREEYCMKTPSV